MKNQPAKQLAQFFLITLAVLGAFLAYQQWQGTQIETLPEDIVHDEAASIAKPTDSVQLSSSEVVKQFYSWYLSYEGNPVVDGSYLESQLVSDRFKELIQSQTSDQEAGQVDPFLLAQDMPQEFEVGESVVENDAAAIKVIFTIGDQEFFRQVDLIKTDGVWQINQVQMIEGIKRATNDDQMEVIVYFSDQESIQEEADCSVVYGATRTIPLTFDLESEIKAALQELFKGPTTKEKDDGLTSFFSDDTSDLLNDFKLVDSTAYIDLNNVQENLKGQNASCAGQALLSQIEETAKHNRQVTQVVISTNGNAQEFYEWLQLGCDESNNFCQTVFEE